MKLTYEWLDLAQAWADEASSCAKVKVGAAIITRERDFHCFGANITIPEGCDGLSCNKILGDGLPHCVSTLHAEIDAIIRARRDLTGATIFVTRYPCENCARAIVAAGISEVVYGRPNEISDEVKKILQGVKVTHIPFFNPEG